MVSTDKKRLSSRRLLSVIGEFDQDNIMANTMIDRQENAMVNEGTVDQELTVGNSDCNPAINVNLVNMKPW